MRLPGFLTRHTTTQYIRLNTHYCLACWQCVEACPEQVLGKAVIGAHRHARVDHAENCKGCKACVRACPHDAIEYTYAKSQKGSGVK
jgi:Pyruvate/2-oxoacid:ferredoxin oxidoreductase delta subunit